MTYPPVQRADIGDGLHIAYREAGPADGRPVVFVHGSGPGASGHSNFKLNYPTFAAAGLRVLVPDSLGYGDSSKPEDAQYTLDYLVGALLRFLDAVGVDRCTLVGNSLGGAMCIKVGLDHPERVERLVLMAPGGRPVHAIVMEYVAGASLGEMLRVLRNRERRLPLIEVLALLRQLAEALAYAHELTDEAGEPLHLIHRDLKPANVLVTATGHLKLLDFGIAKVKDRLAETTRSDSIRGTLRYMSPEQLAGRSRLDHRSDLFSFGAIAYELAMGERMIAGDLMTDALRTLLRFDPGAWLDRAAQVDEPLSALLACLLGPAAVDRPERSQEVVDALTRLLAARGGSPPGLPVTAKLAAAILASRDRVAPAPSARPTPR